MSGWSRHHAAAEVSAARFAFHPCADPAPHRPVNHSATASGSSSSTARPPNSSQNFWNVSP